MVAFVQGHTAYPRPGRVPMNFVRSKGDCADPHTLCLHIFPPIIDESSRMGQRGFTKGDLHFSLIRVLKDEEEEGRVVVSYVHKSVSTHNFAHNL